MIVTDMPQMAQFVYDFYNQKIDMLMIQKDLPQVKLHCYVLIQIVEPLHKYTSNLGFQPGPTQTGLYSHRKRLEA